MLAAQVANIGPQFNQAVGTYLEFEHRRAKEQFDRAFTLYKLRQSVRLQQEQSALQNRKLDIEEQRLNNADALAKMREELAKLKEQNRQLTAGQKQAMSEQNKAVSLGRTAATRASSAVSSATKSFLDLYNKGVANADPRFTRKVPTPQGVTFQPIPMQDIIRTQGPQVDTTALIRQNAAPYVATSPNPRVTAGTLKQALVATGFRPAQVDSSLAAMFPPTPADSTTNEQAIKNALIDIILGKGNK